MSLIRLEISDFRNLGSVRMEPVAEGFNFLFGNNGSGKTSLLESVYYLNRGRSFRSSTLSHIIRDNADKLAVFAEIQTKNNQMTPVGVERSRSGDLRIRISGKDENSFSDLVQLSPTLLINSSCFNLLDAGPVFRRKYLDWGAFYLGNDFLRIWKQYERALKQRNAALRGQISRRELAIWTTELVQSGLQLDQLRREFVRQLQPFLDDALQKLLVLPGLRMKYSQGWDSERGFQEALDQSVEKDLAVGYTQSGPHRADFRITMNNIQLKDILSRGQQKLFICAMMVAQGALLKQGVDRTPIYLIDDLPSELDSVSRSNLMALLASQQAQVFVTAVEQSGLIAQTSMKMFHVEHGNIKEVTYGSE